MCVFTSLIIELQLFINYELQKIKYLAKTILSRITTSHPYFKSQKLNFLTYFLSAYV